MICGLAVQVGMDQGISSLMRGLSVCCAEAVFSTCVKIHLKHHSRSNVFHRCINSGFPSLETKELCGSVSFSLREIANDFTARRTKRSGAREMCPNRMCNVQSNRRNNGKHKEKKMQQLRNHIRNVPKKTSPSAKGKQSPKRSIIEVGETYQVRVLYVREKLTNQIKTDYPTRIP